MVLADWVRLPLMAEVRVPLFVDPGFDLPWPADQHEGGIQPRHCGKGVCQLVRATDSATHRRTLC